MSLIYDVIAFIFFCFQDLSQSLSVFRSSLQQFSIQSQQDNNQFNHQLQQLQSANQTTIVSPLHSSQQSSFSITSSSPRFPPFQAEIKQIQLQQQVTQTMIEQLKNVLDSVQQIPTTITNQIMHENNQSRNTVIGNSQHVNQPNSSNQLVTLICQNNEEMFCSHSDLSQCLIHDGITVRYVCPAVHVQTMKIVLDCLRKPIESVVTLLTANVIPLVLQASNILQIPWLFLYCTSRIFVERNQDLSFLHQLIAESFAANLDVMKIQNVKQQLQQIPQQYQQVRKVGIEQHD